MDPCQTTPTVLIVDDDEHLRESLAELLTGEGYAAAAAADGRTALAYLQQHAPPCLIILDLLMPVMDGWEFRERQRRVSDLAEIPVLVTTALSEEYRRENRLQAQAYLTKPLDVPHLLRVVADCCS
jgi:CheY-like chemotaxis protein